MIKLQVLLAWRNIVKRKFYSSIEVIGLAVGIACFLVILLHVRKEFSYDKIFTGYDQIYRVLNLEDNSGNRYSGGASAIGHHCREDVSQVEKVVRVWYPYRNFSTSALVSYNDVRFYEDNIIEADSNFFEMFDFKFVQGDHKTALRDASSVVISERAAIKYFGSEPPLGKFIGIDNERSLVITGVVDVPGNTHLNFDFLRPAHRDPSQLYVWEHTLAFQYLKVPDASDIPEIERQLYNIILKYSTAGEADYLKNYHPTLQPLTEVHNTILNWDIHKAVPATQLYAIMGIAVFILVLAIINFINLATARASERIRETGISKILGASQSRLTLQFFTEFVVITLFSGLIALALAGASLGMFNAVMNTTLSIETLTSFETIIVLVVLLSITAILSGLYPAWKLSTFRPTQVIKRTTGKNEGRGLREGLVIFQFVISIGLISGTMIIHEQVTFMQNADLGFDKEQVYIVTLRNANRLRFEQLKTSLLSQNGISKVGGASILIGGEPGSDTFHPDHMPQQTPETFAKNIAVDKDFMELAGLELVAGRNFETDNPQDYRTAYIINETAVKQFQLNDPVGANFRRSGETQGRVIGVMKDFYFDRLNYKINPMVFFTDTTSVYEHMYIKIQGDIPSALDAIEESYAGIFPEYPMEGTFQDQYFDSLYKQEQQVASIARWFSVLAILLACLGLLGMSSFIIIQRTKEIGIRKVVGASIADVLRHLTAGFFKLILVGFVISVPLTVFVMSKWLQDFESRITIGTGVFVLAGGLVITVAVITIGFQTLKAAMANPVEALKEE
ncbi:MAG TPA: ABC transporter permease [Cyclobacteriaceae bacterium]|nr:ABC transporter permease [Cyclobacteriaceae bacterium]